MYTGWLRNLKFEVNRPLTVDETKDALPRDAAKSDAYDDHFGLVELNSTYIEWVDRRFRARGSGSCFLLFFASIGTLAAGCFSLWFGLHHDAGEATFLIEVAGFVLGLFFSWLFYWLLWGLDFFQKVYWPIRFNRKNQMIYVYRDKRDGGILQARWDSVYFHIGYGMQTPTFCDIRGEILEGKIVKDTFALGPYIPGLHVEVIREMWAFICRYMDGGPEAVGPDPRDRYVELSLNGSLKDCALVAYSNYGAPNLLIRIVSIPFIAASTLTRWLVFKTCRMPRWPDDIEAACKVDPNDENVWPRPRYTNQFVEENADVRRRTGERIQANRQAVWNAEPKSELSKDMVGLEDLWQQRDRQ